MLALAAAIAAPPPDTAGTRPAGATVRATASIRILSGASISWRAPSAGLPVLRSSMVRAADGRAQSIRLIEFE